MNQVRVGRPNNLKSTFAQFEAKIDIVETDSEMCLIESACLLENGFTDEHARGRNRRIVLLEPSTVEIAGVPSRNTVISNACDATQTDNYAAMLEGPVRIP